MLDDNQKRGTIKLSGRCIWEKRFPLWGQLSYNIHTDKNITCTFTSIVWKDGDWRAHIMKPYLCFSGGQSMITYERLSAMDTVTILYIAGKTMVNDVIYWQVPKLYRRTKSKIEHIATFPLRAYQRRKAAKEMEDFFKDIPIFKHSKHRKDIP